MPKIYRLSRTGLRLYYKIRHHRGHGIHSPFVFGLVTRVIEEKRPFYAYNEIKEFISGSFNLNQQLNKSNLLSFKLVNYFNSKKILEIGAGTGVNTLCLTAPSSDIKCIGIELQEKKYKSAQLLYREWGRNITLHTDKVPQVSEIQDCICVDLRNYDADKSFFFDTLFGIVGNESFIIIKGIRTNKKRQALWKNLRDSQKVTVSLDLYHEGILFFNPKLFKRNYRISF
ncbi:class I SAM-dependent methyltransferase [Dysgonomonas sp. 216]|uniref:class I SAM-dependent methyltransferase n=1 Tax=Dysgonomonas sp. 216 TaxID=2302934 RepID=UPI0013D48936|nr:class I SAM-dependent methyltransferase [Dysgonomonas sp. 216]NDW18366.1 class I SAM-dependent methyltransferase [Dysgonomonas sp. 216]